MLIGCFLDRVGFLGEGVGVKAHVPAGAHGRALWQASLGIDDRVATLCSLDELGVLFLEQAVVLLAVPDPDAVGGEDQVHLLKSTLVGFGVEAVDHGQGDDVGDAEDVVGLFAESLEDDGQHESEPAIADGPANHTPGVTLGTNLEWEDLSRVEPWHSEPGGTEGGCEKEDHSDGSGAPCPGGAKVALFSQVETHACKATSGEHSNALND